MGRRRGQCIAKQVAVSHLGRSEWLSLVDEWILNERDRYIIKRHLLDGREVSTE